MPSRIRKTYEQSALYMGTIIHIKVVTSHTEKYAKEKIKKAFLAFYSVEEVCSRFHQQSELRRLSMQSGKAIQVSQILYQAIRFASQVADLTQGTFDLTLGHTLEKYGFNRHYLTGEKLVSPTVVSANYQDIILDEEKRTVLLKKPLLLDLGAVAKGLAVDLAVQELRDFEGFVIDAGGDLFASGTNEKEEPWIVGIQHPFQKEKIFCKVQLTEQAVCTSGSYERKSPVHLNEHHLIHPYLGTSQSDIVSCTVIAPFAMMADAFSTAAFLLGKKEGAALLKNVDLEGIWITSSLDINMTKGMEEYLYERG
ncbi:FAD:protein FMN transferase [Bacillus pseudomycoides]|uniref:FAD:protein FMN transferase n=1 Tax=Bacillus pseudomycoides TaxID=64104 RepID=UPI000BEE41E8|nr:FAD:protein FMN transferase [Bacillus pseudomycoides]PEE42643.1 thiamine biosynthesis protein ApbE [Bacillus pseudomycoides]PGA93402.1 thiamine biosynthesis protein ApbE [Bacillus pseudomycoides]PHF50934.1 thiamine biosynthesis protein ApbE [Bacillus pseudomycoides]